MRKEPDPHRSSEPDRSPEIPPRLAEGLESLEGHFRGAEPPAALQTRLQAEAARRFGVETRARQPLRLLRGAAWASGLAAAAAALVLVLRTPTGAPPPEELAVAAAEPALDARDVDGSGHVDIFDAYLVAHAAGQNKSVAGMPDLDGDGRVTRADADRIARFAVEVTR